MPARSTWYSWKGRAGEEVGACIDELPVANRPDRLFHQLLETRELDVVERPDRQLGGVQLERETRLVVSSMSWTVSGRTTQLRGSLTTSPSVVSRVRAWWTGLGGDAELVGDRLQADLSPLPPNSPRASRRALTAS